MCVALRWYRVWLVYPPLFPVLRVHLGCHVDRVLRVLSRFSGFPGFPVLPVDIGFRVSMVFHALPPLIPGYWVKRVPLVNHVPYVFHGCLGIRGHRVLDGSRGTLGGWGSHGFLGSLGLHGYRGTRVSRGESGAWTGIAGVAHLG